MYRVLAIGLLVAVCSDSVIVGQSNFGSIVGAVHDASEGAIAGASVQIRSLEDNSTYSTTAGVPHGSNPHGLTRSEIT